MWREIERLHWLIMHNRVWSQADHLIKSYIGSGSTTPVNLPGEIELEIINQYKSGQITNKLFTKAEQAIRDLLRFDSYRRFLKSTPFLWIEVCNTVCFGFITYKFYVLALISDVWILTFLKQMGLERVKRVEESSSGFQKTFNTSHHNCLLWVYFRFLTVKALLHVTRV